MRILFLQLPQLDNDVAGVHENVQLAADYLEYALVRSASNGGHEFMRLDNATSQLGGRLLVDRIVDMCPDVIACTLYLWNVDRTLNVIRAIRRRLKSVRIVAGGPEVAHDHPFLMRSGLSLIDAFVVGEGETTFPVLIDAIESRTITDLANTAWCTGGQFVCGRRQAAPVIPLRDIPAEGSQCSVPDMNGIGYLETTRGCPMRCTFCRYHHLRKTVGILPVDEVLARVRRLAENGAREIRFIDPTFNSHPHWEQIVEKLARLNRDGALRFFAELKGDSLNSRQIRTLVRANFAEIEIGLQSVDGAVLKRIRRATRLDKLRGNLQMLGELGVCVTLDIMYGLPGQTLDDVYNAIEYGRSVPNVRLQCMQTLLLPGTDIRRDAEKWGIRAMSKPPYAVVRTDTMSRAEMQNIENMLAESNDLPSDCETSRFVGYRLKDLFAEKTTVSIDDRSDFSVPDGGSRRALLIEGCDLYAGRQRLVALIKSVVRQDPDIHWQFVLCPDREEPLDLFDMLIREIRRLPKLVIDRYASAYLFEKIASRRVFVRLQRGVRYDAEWVLAVEDYLRSAFF